MKKFIPVEVSVRFFKRTENVLNASAMEGFYGEDVPFDDVIKSIGRLSYKKKNL